MIISNTQTKTTKKITQTVLTQQEHSDQIFTLGAYPGDSISDRITGVNAVCSISGTRYGLVNGVVTQFAVNQPPIEDDGLRGCPAFTQYFLNNEAPVTQSITLAAGSYCLWIEGGGSATFNGLTATAGIPKVFTLASGFTGDCVITGTVTKAMLNSGLFPAHFSPTQGVTKSFVSEASTSTTGTSFDLDDVKLARLKSIMRGPTIGQTELANYSTVQQNQANTGINYVNYLGNDTYRIVSDGSTYIDIRWPSTSAVVGRVYEIIYTEILKTSGAVIGGLGGQNTVFSSGSQTIRVTATTTGFVFVGRNSGAPCDVTFKISVKEIQAQGHLELTFKSNVDSGWLASGTYLGILTNRDAIFGLLYYAKDTNSWRAFDGTNVVQLTSPTNISPAAIFKISLDWGTHPTGQKMRITVNGVKSALADFSGSFGAQDLRFFYGNTIHAGWIVKDSLKIFERPRW